MSAKRLPSETPTFYWDSRADPSDTFRTLEALLTDLQTRLLIAVNDHADLIDNGQLLSFTVAALPAVTVARMIYVSDEAGGAVPAFSDGTNWRRVTDRAVVS